MAVLADAVVGAKAVVCAEVPPHRQRVVPVAEPVPQQEAVSNAGK